MALIRAISGSGGGGSNFVDGNITSNTITINGKIKKLLLVCGNGGSGTSSYYIVCKYDADISTTSCIRLAYAAGGSFAQNPVTTNFPNSSYSINNIVYSNGVTTITVNAGTVTQGYYMAELD